MITGKQLGKIAAHMEKAKKPIIKGYKGDTCLVCFTSVITTKDFKTTCRDYYQFCIVAHCDRAGRVMQVQRKGSDALYPVTSECFMVSAEKCGGLNLVNFLGNEQFKTPQDAITATKALFAVHGVAMGGN
jgi:hypothetical protein